jgi:hypothetical protein
MGTRLSECDEPRNVVIPAKAGTHLELTNEKAEKMGTLLEDEE